MTLLIKYVLYFSILVNGQWLPQAHTGVLVDAKQTCQEGLQFYRKNLGAEDKFRFDAFECVETWLNADGTRYSRPE